MISAVITAGGSSSRFTGGNKLLYKINGVSVIETTVNKFLSLDFIDEIVVTANVSIIKELEGMFRSAKVKIVEGGATRQESVFNGLKACTNCEYVLIHDGARPFIIPETIAKSIENVKKTRATIVAVKTIDTVKIADENGIVVSTPDRKTLWNAQTPQTFEYKLIYELHKKYQGCNYTDDSLLCEQEKIPVSITEGEYDNIKITTVADLKNIC